MIWAFRLCMHKYVTSIIARLVECGYCATCIWYPHHVEIQAVLSGQYESTSLGARFHVFKAMGTRLYMLDRSKVCDSSHH